MRGIDMVIVEIKSGHNNTGVFDNRGILSVLSHSQYMPTQEKLSLLADTYEADDSVLGYACCVKEIAIGVIVLKAYQEAVYEILSLAVDPAYKGQRVWLEADSACCGAPRPSPDLGGDR